MFPHVKRPLLLGLTLLVAAFFYWVPPLPQDPAYHQFADHSLKHASAAAAGSLFLFALARRQRSDTSRAANR